MMREDHRLAIQPRSFAVTTGSDRLIHSENEKHVAKTGCPMAGPRLIRKYCAQVGTRPARSNNNGHSRPQSEGLRTLCRDSGLPRACYFGLSSDSNTMPYEKTFVSANTGGR